MNIESITPCRFRDGMPCQSFRPGHHMHQIHASRIGERPWGWRDAIVTGIDGHVIAVAYVRETGGAAVWHHRLLTDVLRSGDPVRLHEQYYALGMPAGWFSVVVHGGLGPVPTPEDTELWRGRMTSGVVDYGTGTGLALDHLDP